VSLQDADRLRDDYAGRGPVTEAQLALGATGWAAIRSPTPRAVVDLLEADLTPLPFLRGALARLLQELPGRDGLARSERQILRAVADGATDLEAAFAATQALEEAPYLGDASFGLYVRRLGSGLAPLLREGAGSLALTELGRVVLDQREDWTRMAGLQRWLGGVRLCPESLWRWDAERRAIRLTVREPW
jgi:hypothetical protein